MEAVVRVWYQVTGDWIMEVLTIIRTLNFAVAVDRGDADG
jgi:hypothetical protein